MEITEQTTVTNNIARIAVSIYDLIPDLECIAK